MEISLQGFWEADIGDGKVYSMMLPGTLDENRIGYPDTGSNQWHPDITLGNESEAFQTKGIATRFTRRYTYEGEARMTRRVTGDLWKAIAGEMSAGDGETFAGGAAADAGGTAAGKAGKRLFLEAQRARTLRLLVDGEEVPHWIPPSISTEQIFEVTGLLREGSELTLLSDNSYPGLPHDAIVYSSAATDETQTNWNGVLGYLRIRSEQWAFLDEFRVYPGKDSLTVKCRLCADRPFHGEVRLSCDALEESICREVTADQAFTELVFEALPLREGVRRWDLEEGNLYELTAFLSGGECGNEKEIKTQKTVPFGIRTFGDDGSGRLAINGRRFFLRGEANCGEFPETGHPPMTVEEWEAILKRFRSYGVNCMRFHSHCPPEAAFAAADRLGMLMQPELSHWNPRDAFESEESFRYYRTELLQILRMLANHPSFVMLTFGNELSALPKGQERMKELLELARHTDPTRLYANASNAFYGNLGCDAGSDFYTSQHFKDGDLRATSANMTGYLNRHYPGTETDYDETMKQLRTEYQKPVFSFEVGQYEILPDFDELADFRGISDPVNFRLIQERVASRGLQKDWKKYVEATGELSRLCYREEVEAALRTRELSGISLLGLQDFPGQGTALVGMLNSHLQPKPFDFARPEHFRSFFRDQLPLALLPRYTWESGDTLSVRILVANYGKEDLCGVLEYELREHKADGKGYSCAADGMTDGKHDFCPDDALTAGGSGDGKVLAAGRFAAGKYPQGALTEAGLWEFPLASLEIRKAVRLDLLIRLGNCSNLYPLWVYPRVQPQCPESVYETRYLDEKAREVLEKGGKVYLSPPSVKEALPHSIQAQFSTDFWSVGTFAGQEGGMGLLIDESHPLFESFPTEFHTNWQWWPMASARAVILPKPYRAIVTQMDSYAFLRPMCQLLECRCGRGKLLFSSFGLQDLQQYPEARALLDAIYRYLDSERFAPEQEIGAEVFETLVNPVKTSLKRQD